jgi:peptidoglycan/xylan/chitin deacetylase (PgdA/CDA1 family)
MKAVSLSYHDVVENGRFDASGRVGPGPARYKLDLRDFERHIGVIAQARGDRTVLATDLLRNGKLTCPFLVTFDDGGSSATRIADVLERHGWRGHFFIIAGSIGTPSFTNEAQLRDLHSRGHVIGSHTWSHPLRLSCLEWPDLVEEWSASVKRLSDIVGARVCVASVPGGYYSPRVARAATQVGIQVLFNSEPTMKCRSIEGCLILGRFTLRRGMSAEFAMRIASGERSACWPEAIRWNVKKLPKTLGGGYYLKLREFLVQRENHGNEGGSLPGANGMRPHHHS